MYQANAASSKVTIGFRPPHALSFDIQHGTAKVRYWQLPDLHVATERQVDDIGLLDELETLLEDSVRRQLVADVPVGVLLSGGVDSSLITASAMRACQPGRAPSAFLALAVLMRRNTPA